MHNYTPPYVPSIWRLPPHAPAGLRARPRPRLPSGVSYEKEGSCRTVLPQPPGQEAAGGPSPRRLLPPAASEPLPVPSPYLSWESDASTLGSPVKYLTHSGDGSAP